MVSDRPLPGRCGAVITDKIGIEIDCGDITLTDSTVDSVLLGDSIQCDANYGDCREFLWKDYEPTAVAIEDPDEDGIDRETRTVDPDQVTDDAPDTSSHTWFDIDPVNITNDRTRHDGYCERYPNTDSDWCDVHNNGGGHEGNTNPMKHGLYAQRTNFYKALSDDEQAFVEALVESWIRQSSYGRDNVAMVNDLYRCAIDQLRAWFGLEEYVDKDGNIEGLVKEQQVFDGDEIHHIEDENSLNMPYSRLDKDIQSRLKDWNIYESPESQEAEATESLAQALSDDT
jgi:hypothetical protein